jgi:hypothetical protein
LAANAVRLHLHALAYNLGNFMRTLAMPKAAQPWSLTSLREKLIKIGAKVAAMAATSPSKWASRSVAADVPGNPVADRPAADTARANMRSVGAQMRETTAEVRLQSRPTSPGFGGTQFIIYLEDTDHSFGG